MSEQQIPEEHGPAQSDPAHDAGAAEVGHELILESLEMLHQAHLQREQAMVLLAVQWARLNTVTAQDYVAANGKKISLSSVEAMWAELEQRGCPRVDDLTVPAFAASAGLTEFQATRLIRESLLLVYCLPRVWQRAAQGQLDVWRVRKLAEECADLNVEALDYIDRQMSLSTARHTQGGRDGIITEAKLRFMAAEVEQEQEEALEHRCLEFDWEHKGHHGVVFFGGALDYADARELETAVQVGAQALKDLGSKESLSVRRAWALGDLARSANARGEDSLGTLRSGDHGAQHGAQEQLCAGCLQLRQISDLSQDENASKTLQSLRMPEALQIPQSYQPLQSSYSLQPLPMSEFFLPAQQEVRRPHWNGVGSGQTRMNVYLHLTPDALIGANESEQAQPRQGGFSPVRVEGKGILAGTVLTAKAVREWFNRPSLAPGAKIIFRPVIDLQEHQHVEAYEVPDRIKELVSLRDGGCVFPWCHRKARRTDCDHTIPWKPDGTGGPTCSCNLAPMCRTHHRAKTHADNHRGSRYTWWRYESLGEGRYLWRGPAETLLLRTNSGVYDLSPGQQGAGPRLPYQRRLGLTLHDLFTNEPELAVLTGSLYSIDLPTFMPRSGSQKLGALLALLQESLPAIPEESAASSAVGSQSTDDANGDRDDSQATDGHDGVWGEDQEQPPPF